MIFAVVILLFSVSGLYNQDSIKNKTFKGEIGGI